MRSRTSTRPPRMRSQYLLFVSGSRSTIPDHVMARVDGPGASWATEVGCMDERESYCPVFHRAVELIGRRWNGPIIRALLDGAERFGEIRSRIPGLTDRLSLSGFASSSARAWWKVPTPPPPPTPPPHAALRADGQGPLTDTGDRVHSRVSCQVGGPPRSAPRGEQPPRGRGVKDPESLREVFDFEESALVVGGSMGAQQTWNGPCAFPTSAPGSPHRRHRTAHGWRERGADPEGTAVLEGLRHGDDAPPARASPRGPRLQHFIAPDLVSDSPTR